MTKSMSLISMRSSCQSQSCVAVFGSFNEWDGEWTWQWLRLMLLMFWDLTQSLYFSLRMIEPLWYFNHLLSWCFWNIAPIVTPLRCCGLLNWTLAWGILNSLMIGWVNWLHDGSRPVSVLVHEVWNSSALCCRCLLFHFDLVSYLLGATIGAILIRWSVVGMICFDLRHL